MNLEDQIVKFVSSVCDPFCNWLAISDANERAQPVVSENTHNIPKCYMHYVHDQIVFRLDRFCEQIGTTKLSQSAHVAIAFSPNGNYVMIALIPKRRPHTSTAYIGLN